MSHIWGDEWFEKYGDDLYQAERYIRGYVKKWSSCNLITKEKYGSIRYEWIFPPGGAVSWRKFDYLLAKVFGKKEVKPTQWTKESYYVPRIIWQGSWLYRQWSSFGRYVLRKAVLNAIRKWPHIKREIVEDFDGGKYING